MRKKTAEKTVRTSVGVLQRGATTADERTLLNANASEADAATKKAPLVITVDTRMSRAEMVKAGNYTAHNPIISRTTPNAKKVGAEKFECRIFHFDQIISSSDARRKIAHADRKNPWKPAGIEHLLALGATMPYLQGQFPITELGTLFKKNGLPQVACLHHGDGPKRNLILRWWGDDWCGDFAFLGVRKLGK